MLTARGRSFAERLKHPGVAITPPVVHHKLCRNIIKSRTNLNKLWIGWKMLLRLHLLLGPNLHRNAENSFPHFQSLPTMVPALTSRWSSSHPLRPQRPRAEANKGNLLQKPGRCSFSADSIGRATKAVQTQNTNNWNESTDDVKTLGRPATPGGWGGWARPSSEPQALPLL